MNYKIETSFKLNNFISSFEFIEENNSIGNESFIANETSYKIDDNKILNLKQEKIKKLILLNITIYYINIKLTAGSWN